VHHKGIAAEKMSLAEVAKTIVFKGRHLLVRSLPGKVLDLVEGTAPIKENSAHPLLQQNHAHLEVQREVLKAKIAGAVEVETTKSAFE
jgi:hypothetical protein